MPGMALRIAASMTVAPFSTSMMRVSPEWSTKWILAMLLVLPKKSVRQSYNGSIQSRLVRRIQHFRAANGRLVGLTQECVDRAFGLFDRAVEIAQGVCRVAARFDQR